MVERLAPGVFVCCSADLIPRWGEYERTVATVLNAYLGPVMSRYLGRLESPRPGGAACATRCRSCSAAAA